MRAIKLDVDGTIGYFEVSENFWMDGGTVWAEGPYPGEDEHVVNYDDEALFAKQQVRTTLRGIDYPLPMWILGISGDEYVSATLSIDKVISDLGARRYPLLDGRT